MKKLTILASFLAIAISTVQAQTVDELLIVADSANPQDLQTGWQTFIQDTPDVAKQKVAKRSLLAHINEQVEEGEENPLARAFISYLAEQYPELLEEEDMKNKALTAAIRQQIAGMRPDLKPAQLQAADSDQELATLVTLYGPSAAVAQRIQKNPTWVNTAIALVTHSYTNHGIVREALLHCNNDAVRLTALLTYPQDPYVLVLAYQTAKTDQTKYITGAKIDPEWVKTVNQRNPIIFKQLNKAPATFVFQVEDRTYTHDDSTGKLVQVTLELDKEQNSRGPADRVTIKRSAHMDSLEAPDINALLVAGNATAYTYNSSTHKLTPTPIEQAAVHIGSEEAKGQINAGVDAKRSKEMDKAVWPDATPFLLKAWPRRPAPEVGIHATNLTAEMLATANIRTLAIEHGDAETQRYVLRSIPLTNQDIQLLANSARHNVVLKDMLDSAIDHTTVKQAILANWRIDDETDGMLQQLYRKDRPEEEDLNYLVDGNYPESSFQILLQLNDTPEMWKRAATSSYTTLALAALQKFPENYEILQTVLQRHGDTIVSSNNIQAKGLIEANPNYAKAYEQFDLGKQETYAGFKATSDATAEQEMQQQANKGSIAVSKAFWTNPSGEANSGSVVVTPNEGQITAARAKISSADDGNTKAEQSVISFIEQQADIEAQEKQQIEGRQIDNTFAPHQGTSSSEMATISMSSLEAEIRELEEQANNERSTWEGRSDLARIDEKHAQWQQLPANAKVPPYYNAVDRTADYESYLRDQWEKAYFSPDSRLKRLTEERNRRRQGPI